jgi:hypothetical protein
MSTQITLRAPAPVAMPRGAVWAAEAFAAVSKWLARVWRAESERRAHQRLLNEAADLRRTAADISRYDPAFAADLNAAADRHMASYGA